jgi:hypothetical protein
MSALINTLDNYTPKQIGENGHLEYAWSNNIKEQICQFSSQIVRSNDSELIQLRSKFTNLLQRLKEIYDKDRDRDSDNECFKEVVDDEKKEARSHLCMLYKLIAQTRDIIDGKGEYKLTYMMIYVWYTICGPSLAFFAINSMVQLNSNEHPYGSWKDLKYFCDYITSNHNIQLDHPLIKHCCFLYNNQLKFDEYNMNVSENNELKNISLVAKWIPREKSRFGYLYDLLAYDYYKEYISTSATKSPLTQAKAMLKCKTHYRKLLAKLNVIIDTLQIKQCGKNWSSINFDKVTSISISKQKHALLNVKKDGKKRTNLMDRIICAEHFKEHIKSAVKDNKEIKGKRVGLTSFTSQAIELIVKMKYNKDETTQMEYDLLNSQWRDNSSQNGKLGNIIPMVDVSGSMDGDPLHAAIALGIRVAEKSLLGKRVLTFSSLPRWVNLHHKDNFVDMVEEVNNADFGLNTNFHAALVLILNAIVEAKMPSEDVENMVLAIFSDMQIDEGDRSDKKVLYDVMKEKYANAGIKVNGKPYNPPHILFWNLRSTNGFPTLSSQTNTSMMSGFSPALLNLFCNEGIESLQNCTPWILLEKSLNIDRYKIMEEKFNYEF